MATTGNDGGGGGDTTASAASTAASVRAARAVAEAGMSKRERLEKRTAEVLAEAPDLASLTTRILGALQRHHPVTVPGMDPALHWLPPHIPKSEWTALGNLVVARERAAAFGDEATAARGCVPGEQWMSLRLDGSNFSKVVKTLRRRGVLETERKYSARFAACMQHCLRALMVKFGAQVGYTQSDEMMVLVPPASVVRGEQQVHARSGRVVKTATLAAGYVTAQFVLQLARLAQAADANAGGGGGGGDGGGSAGGGGDTPATDEGPVAKKPKKKGESDGNGAGEVDFLAELAGIAPHFDCRVGSFDSWEEARALLLWRAYDCSVNGVSDAVYQTPGSGRAVQSLGKREKIEWLWRANCLPLPKHQAYGTAMARVRRPVDGFNPITKTTTVVLRRTVEPLPAGVLQLAIAGALDAPPQDATIEDTATDAAAAADARAADAAVACTARAAEAAATATVTATAAVGEAPGAAVEMSVEFTSPARRIPGENKSKLLRPASRFAVWVEDVRARCRARRPEWNLDARPAHVEVLKPRDSKAPDAEALAAHRTGQLQGRVVRVHPLEVMNRRAVVLRTGPVDGYGDTHVTVGFFRGGVTPAMLAEMQVYALEAAGVPPADAATPAAAAAAQ